MRWEHLFELVRSCRVSPRIIEFFVWRCRLDTRDETWDFLAHSESHSFQRVTRDHIEIGSAHRQKTLKSALTLCHKVV